MDTLKDRAARGIAPRWRAVGEIVPDDECTYFQSTAEPLARLPSFSGSRRCDVCVVGAGYAGLSAALHLAERGLDAIVLEAAYIGAGASGRNSGFVLPGYAADAGELVSLIGRDRAAHAWQLSIAAVELVRSLIATHAIRCDLKTGAVAAAASPADARALAVQAGILRDFGYRHARMLSRGGLADMVASPNYHGGLFDSGAVHLHPLRYARGLARAALARGVSIHEQSRALRIVRGDRPQVITANGTVTARHIVLATNAFVGPLSPNLGRRIVPVTTLIGTTERLGADAAQRLLPTDIAVFDTQPALDYYRLTPDHRLLFGAATRLMRPADARSASWLARQIARVFPQLGPPRMEFVWHGVVDLTANRLPDIGQRGKGVWYAQGFNGHGIALATLAGRAIADAIAGRDEDFAVLANLPYRPWPGGQRLARAVLPLVRSGLQLRHKLGRLRG